MATVTKLRVGFAAVVLGVLSGCVSAPKELPPLDATRFGLSACEPSVMEECRRIAGKTFHSIGPRQVEYHAPDGRVFLWVGNKIVRGYWGIHPKRGLISGTNICYLYEGEITADCSPLGNKGDGGVNVRDGDPYELATRSDPPYNLRDLPAFAGSFDVVDARLNEVR